MRARKKVMNAPDKALRGCMVAQISPRPVDACFSRPLRANATYITVNLLICMRTNASVVELLNHGLYVKDVVVPAVVAPPEEE